MATQNVMKTARSLDIYFTNYHNLSEIACIILKLWSFICVLVCMAHIRRSFVLHIEVRLPVLLCAVKTVEGDFRFCWTATPNVGQTHKENPNLVRILYMVCTLNDIYKQYNKLHEH